MTNPNNAIGTNGAYGGRTSVEALNDISNVFTGGGIVRGWECSPSSGMTVALGGVSGYRDVAIAVSPTGTRTTVNNRTTSPVNVTLSTAPASNSRIDVIVAYVQNPPQGSTTVVDNAAACGIIPVSGTVSSSPTAPSDSAIRSAITADGATGSTAYYVILATITVASGVTTITSNYITQGAKAVIGGENVALPCLPKCIISSHSASNTTINGATVIPLSAVDGTIGSGISVNNGKFVIGSGISYVLVSASWTCEPKATGFRRVAIRKNNTLTDGYSFTTTDVSTGYLNGAVSGILLSVSKGDVIDLYNRDTQMLFWTGTGMAIVGF